MLQVIGFALFFISIGMFIMMFIPSKIVGGIIIVCCLVIGYNLFCHHNCK